MSHNRWYDKEENLRTIVESLKGLDPSARNAFALDVIQSAISKQADKDNFLEILNNEMISDAKRWYDDSEIVMSAIEMLKYLPPEEVEELFKDLVISMMCQNENHIGE